MSKGRIRKWGEHSGAGRGSRTWHVLGMLQRVYFTVVINVILTHTDGLKAQGDRVNAFAFK